MWFRCGQWRLNQRSSSHALLRRAYGQGTDLPHAAAHGASRRMSMSPAITARIDSTTDPPM